MSQLQEFLQLVNSDSALQQQLATAHDNEQVIKLMLELGLKRGYSFTQGEVADWMKQQQDSGELSTEQLEAVAGGLTSLWCNCGRDDCSCSGGCGEEDTNAANVNQAFPNHCQVEL